MVRVGDRAGPIKLWMTCGVEESPIRADATFEDLPWLIDCFDNVVVDAVSFGAADEVAQGDRLLNAPRIGVLHIVAGAWPAELGDDDALAGIGLAKFVIDQHGLIDSLRLRESFPIGQYVRGDVVDRRNKLGMLDPYVPDFACCHRNVG